MEIREDPYLERNEVVAKVTVTMSYANELNNAGDCLKLLI